MTANVNYRLSDWVFFPVAILLVGGVGAAGLLQAESVYWIPALYITIGFAAWIAWRTIRWGDDWARYASFGAIILLVCALQRSLYLLDYGLSVPSFENWPVASASPEWSMFKGEMITILGTLLTVAAWLSAGGLRISSAAAFTRVSTDRNLLWVIYVTSAIGLVAAQLSPGVFGELGQALQTILGLGLVACFFLPVAHRQKGITAAAWALVLSVPFFVAALGEGMKEDLIFALMPSGIHAWRAAKGALTRVLLVAVGIALAGIVTAYVMQYRSAVWYADSESTTTEVVQTFVANAGANGLSDAVSEGAERFLSRNNSSLYRGWAVSIADEEGYRPELVFSPLAYTLIPRFIWPSKPEIRQGWEYSGIVFGDYFVAWSDSSTSAGLYTSFYLGAGWIGVILGSSGVGLLLAFCTQLSLRFGGPVAPGLYSFSLVPFLIRLDETWSVGALTGPLVTLAYLLILLWLIRFVSNGTPRTMRP